ncbi:MAG TPA: ABC transporter transmembrane domain-containing protein [Stellaceae bacterium]|nr:ABC transporter transmembrane domain-containing protein [Stellaceae bacterium]
MLGTPDAPDRTETLGALPVGVFRYILMTSWPHQLALIALSILGFLLEIVPLELQRRAVNDLVKGRSYRWVILIAVIYSAVVLVQGGTKLALNIYRGWVGERAKRDLRRHIQSSLGGPSPATPEAEAQGIAVSMIVAEVEPIGGFIGESVSEPLLHGGVLVSVFAYITHIDPWMALAALSLLVPQFVFVPLLQGAVNRNTGQRIRILRQLGSGLIAANHNGGTQPPLDDGGIDRVFALDMGIFYLKFTMNFLMNLFTHLQIVAGLLVGGYWVYEGRLEIGGVVAFISGIGRLTDPWGDIVNYFRDLNVTQVKYRLLANALGTIEGRDAPSP